MHVSEFNGDHYIKASSALICGYSLNLRPKSFLQCLSYDAHCAFKQALNSPSDLLIKRIAITAKNLSSIMMSHCISLTFEINF